MPRVIVSAGHTNDDPGSKAKGLVEVDLTRKIARKLVPSLRSAGIITLSVPPNLDLQKRIDWINGTGYKAELNDISLEIHINEGGKSGLEFWHKEGADKSKELAQTIMDSVKKDTDWSDQGVKSESKHEFGSLAFVSKTNTISVLLECGYIDNDSDVEKLKDESFLDKLAKSISDGVTKFLKIDTTQAVSAAQPPAVNSQPVAVSSTPPRAVPPPAVQPYNPAYSSSGGFGHDDGFGSSSFGSAAAPQMSRDERKDMINTTYKKILGREPNQNDLNYFLNIGITEDKLIKRMMESQEHLDLVNAKKERDELKKKSQEMQIELTRLRAENNDSQTMLNNLKKLLHQKNRHIAYMKDQLGRFSNQPQEKPQQADKREYKGGLLDRFFHLLSTFLG